MKARQDNKIRIVFFETRSCLTAWRPLLFALESCRWRAGMTMPVSFKSIYVCAVKLELEINILRKAISVQSPARKGQRTKAPLLDQETIKLPQGGITGNSIQIWLKCSPRRTAGIKTIPHCSFPFHKGTVEYVLLDQCAERKPQNTYTFTYPKKKDPCQAEIRLAVSLELTGSN